MKLNAPLWIMLVVITIQSYGQSAVQELKKLQRQRIQVNEDRAKRLKVFQNNRRSAFTKQGFLLVDVTPSGIPIYKAPLNAGAALTTGASRLQNSLIGLDLQGENMTVGIWDDGIVKTHIELDNRILSKEGLAEQTHATHVTGTILASGVNALAKGMAPKARATTWYFDNDIAEMVSLARTDQTGLLFSNHSYGTITGWFKLDGNWSWSGDPSISTDEDYRFGYYSGESQALDQVAFLAPYYTIVWAAGNDRAEVGDGTFAPDGNGGTGYDCIIPESTAKNLITVGAVEKVTSYTGPSSVVLSNFSSTGPTDDGRIKPDLVAAGVNLFSLSASGVNQYTTLSGTSMATPNTTGSLVLLQELYSKLHGGNYMKAATLKGLAIHTTKEAGSFAGPDYHFGWGLLDVEAAAKVLLAEDNENVVIKELTLPNNSSYVFALQSKANEKITVTVCWTDPAGNPVVESLDPTDAMLVNDLDVRVTDSLGTVIYPWILDPFNPANKATTGDNIRDNVEKIEFDNPAAKKYYITVSHKGQLLSGKQDFSLVITGKSSLSTSKTYYWIGNTGTWSDGSHWSLSSGGVASNTVPTSLDNVVFDENSFDNVSERTVSLSVDAACKKISWITDKASALSLNNHTLKIGSGFSSAGKNFNVSTAGTLQFEGNGVNAFSLHSGDFSKASVLFNGGTWNVSGKFAVNSFIVLKDVVSLAGATCTITTLNASANTTLNIHGSTITGLTQSTITGYFETDGSSVHFTSPANLNWNGLTYDGALYIETGAALTINGSNNIFSLAALPGATLQLSDGTVLYLASSLDLNGSQNNVVKVQSPGKASIILGTHEKKCFDYLDVLNVDISGSGVVSAGLHSTVVNSVNWIQKVCDDVLFADFDATYLCTDAHTNFIDKSSGNITTWSWNFDDASSAENAASSQNAFHTFNKAGTYAVTLNVSDGTTSDSYSQELIVKTNDLPSNTILFNGNSLISFRQALTYQWYLNGTLIEGANSRNYNYDGNPGIYSIVIMNDGECNATSSYVITGVEDNGAGISLFPNPVTDGPLHLSLKNNPLPVHIKIMDALGHPVYSGVYNEQEIAVDLKHLSNGLYHITIQSSSFGYSNKVVIQR